MLNIASASKKVLPSSIIHPAFLVHLTPLHISPESQKPGIGTSHEKSGVQSSLLLTAQLGLSKLRSFSQRISVLEHQDGYESQKSTKGGQEKTGILASKVMEELRGKKWCNASKGIVHQAPTSNHRRRAFFITARSKAAGRFEDKESSDRDRGKCDGRPDASEVSILCEGVDEL